MGTTGSFGTGNIVIESGAIVDFNRSNAYTCANVISGAGKVRNIAAGPLTLSGANTYTGGTDLVFGTISFANGSLGSSGTIAFTGSSCTLRWESGNTQDVSSRLSLGSATATIDTQANNVTFATAISNASVALLKSGSGTLTLTGANNTVSVFTVSAGSASVGGGGSIGTWTGGLSISSGATLIFNHSNDLTISTTGSGAGGFTKLGTGKLSFSTGVTGAWTGQTTIDNGWLAINLAGNGDVSIGASGKLSHVTDSDPMDINDLDIAAGGVLELTVDAAGPSAQQINCNDITLATGALLNINGTSGNFAVGLWIPLLFHNSITGAFANHADGSTINTGASFPYAATFVVHYDYLGTGELGILAT